MSTKIRIECKGYSAEIEVERDDLAIDDMIESLVKPALLGIGYAETSVNEALGREQ